MPLDDAMSGPVPLDGTPDQHASGTMISLVTPRTAAFQTNDPPPARRDGHSEPSPATGSKATSGWSWFKVLDEASDGSSCTDEIMILCGN